ncbi:HNH homing endonuclease 2 [Bacillus phage BSP10]|nr:HNH homing endonuclease 2 [Bacillus phage BSP10]AYJ75784.1 HNH homing endonuclease 2 [Bacillus phage BSP18]
MSKKLTDSRIGVVKYNRYGSRMQVIQYNNAKDITVKFENGFTKKAAWNEFCKGTIKSVYDRTVHKVGYLGEGIYTYNTHRAAYNTWSSMLNRCYGKTGHKAYKDCTVATEWHNFQNFCEWFEDNYYEVNEERTALDKDILYKGNRVYSSDTCVFVPKTINSLFIRNRSTGSNLPIGVYFDKKKSMYRAKCNAEGTEKFIGRYSNLNEAFNAYKYFKESYIKRIAEEYKKDIPEKLYYALLSYEVDIND